jgi:hypothetical protein
MQTTFTFWFLSAAFLAHRLVCEHSAVSVSMHGPACRSPVPNDIHFDLAPLFAPDDNDVHFLLLAIWQGCHVLR